MRNKPVPPPYILHSAKGEISPFIFAAPHSGRYYPPDFQARSALATIDLQRSEDAFVDLLFQDVTTFGGTQLVATHARAYLDLNRATNELDATMFAPRLNTKNLNTSQRVKVGLGLIPRIIAEGVPIYKGLLPAREVEKRLTSVHTPYHHKLSQLLTARRKDFGLAYLIDCHSMPSENNHGRKTRSQSVDIVLGDSWGSACTRDLTSLAEELFIAAGFRVRRNVPYSGGYSTVHYGNPAQNIHALQIEINRAIYMDEASQTRLPEFDPLRETIGNVCKQIIRRSKMLTQPQITARAAE